MRYLFQAVAAELLSLGMLGALTTPIGPLTAFFCLLLFLSGVTWMARSAYCFCNQEFK